MKALTFSQFGPADVLDYLDIMPPTPNNGEVLIEMHAIGLNYADIYRRKGQYHLAGHAPYINGYEGAGVVVASRSPEFKKGDRVGFADVPFANAELVAAPASHLIPLVDTISFTLAATVLLQGLTAHYLACDSHGVKSGEWVLIQAASGGVGQLLTQICTHKGARVIGLSRSREKLPIIEACGAKQAILLDKHWQQSVLDLTGGSGVDVAYDSVGTTLMASMAVTKACGQIVFYGMSGGEPAAFDPRMLLDSSKSITGADLWCYLTCAEQRRQRANQLFNWIEQGVLRIAPAVTFALSEGRAAHEFLESGQSAGKVILIPDSVAR